MKLTSTSYNTLVTTFFAKRTPWNVSTMNWNLNLQKRQYPFNEGNVMLYIGLVDILAVLFTSKLFIMDRKHNFELVSRVLSTIVLHAPKMTLKFFR